MVPQPPRSPSLSTPQTTQPAPDAPPAATASPAASDMSPARAYVPRENRITRTLLTARLVAATGVHLCRARNVSANGMAVECAAPLARGDVVTIELRSETRATGRVAWGDGTRLGIAFDASIDVDALLHRSDPVNGLRPRAPRLDVDGIALVRSDGRPHAYRLENLSQSGCRLIGQTPVRVGAEVMIAIPGLPARRATVRWIEEDRSGYAFHLMQSFADLATWQAERTPPRPVVQ